MQASGIQDEGLGFRSTLLYCGIGGFDSQGPGFIHLVEMCFAHVYGFRRLYSAVSLVWVHTADAEAKNNRRGSKSGFVGALPFPTFRPKLILPFAPKMRGPQYRSQYTTTLMIGTPKKGTRNLGNPPLYFWKGLP